MISKILILILLFSISGTVFSQEKPDTKYFIIFKDKGEFSPGEKITPGDKAYETGKSILSERALIRRLKVLSEDELISFMDLPLEDSYVEGVKNSGVEIITISRWLNGVSAYLTEAQVKQLENLDYVSHVKTVNKLFKQKENSVSIEETLGDDTTGNRYDYGNSWKQMSTVNVPKVHNLNITGKGVMIASFDDGFDWKNHEALRNLNVTGEYDFINKDENTFAEKNQKYNDSKNQGAHGTSTLSTMSGFKNGKLVSPAFDSEILLAKTEYVSSETPMEEDFWLEASEWAEAKGVDIVTSSLIYKKFDNPFDNNSYEYKDFNGRTALTSVAAARLAYLGVVVCQAMGNYDQTTVPSLGSAADADSIISVGAITFSGNPASFTSNGPTSDGRTKPDVVAPGVYVYNAVTEEISGNDSTYSYANGTSFSTPITAGICAMILSVHPELTPLQVRDAIRNSASLSGNPNNILGWGIVNAYDAILYNGPAWSNTPEFKANGNVTEVSTYLASKDLIDPISVKFNYSMDGGMSYESVVMKLKEHNGDKNNSGKYSALIENFPDLYKSKYYFSAEDYNGSKSVYPKEVSFKD